MNAQDRRLGEALGFSDDELALNRTGRLSDPQRERMARSRSRGIAGNRIVGIAVVVFIVLIGILVIPNLAHERGSGSSPAAPAGVAALAVVGVVMWFSMRRTRGALDRLMPEHVERVQGVTTTREHRIRGNVGDPSTGFIGYGGGVRYEVTIGSTRFFVKDRSALHAFEDGKPYRGYFVGRGAMATLLSAEPSDEPATGTI